MPITVSELEQRYNDTARDVVELKTQFTALTVRLDGLANQLAVAINAMNTVQAQIAASNAKLDTAADGLKGTNARLDAAVQQFEARTDAITTKIDAQASALAEFRGEAKAVFAFARWAGVTTFAILVTAVGVAFSMSRAIGHVDGTLQEHAKTVREIQRGLDDLRAHQKNN